MLSIPLWPFSLWGPPPGRLWNGMAGRTDSSEDCLLLADWSGSRQENLGEFR